MKIHITTSKIYGFFIALLIGLLGLLMPNSLKAQSAYYDAIRLAESFEHVEVDQFYGILGTYTDVRYKNEADIALIRTRLITKGNTILAAYLDLFEKRKLKPQQMLSNMPLSSIPNGRAGYPGQSSGGIGWSTVADGLSKFIVGRVKEELFVSFFERLRRDFADPTKPELRLLFPTTGQFIEVISDYNVGMMIEVLRQAFQKDFNQLPQHLPKLANLAKYDNFIQDHQPLMATLAGAAGLSYLIENKDHPSKVINKLANLDYIKKSDNINIKRAINTLSFVNKSLLDPASEAGTWITREQLRYLESVRQAPILFMGLNIQRHGNLIMDMIVDADLLPISTKHFAKSAQLNNRQINVRDLVSAYRITPNSGNDQALIDSTTYSQYFLFQPYFEGFLDLVTTVNEVMEDIKKKKSTGETIDFDQIITYAESFIDILVFAADQTTFGTSEEDTRFLRTAPLLLDLRRTVNQNEYTSAIVYLNMILVEALPEYLGPTDEILKYGLFMANVASAQNSDEVHRAIEAVALPTGSAAVKRRSAYNISLNTYAGPYIGSEYLYSPYATQSWAGSGGLYAPLGVAFSKGFGNYGSLTLFTSIVDVGAIVNFRFSDPSTARLPEFKLQNIIAPGAYLIYGVPNIPVSAGFGVQYGPQLREISVNNTTIDLSAAYRISGFIGVDIPILNFYTTMH